MDNDLFRLLVRYYCEEKWTACRRDVKDGIFYDRYDDDFGIGDENPFHGALIVANGDTLAGELVQQELVKENPLGKFIPTRTIDDFCTVMDRIKKRDRAMIYDGVNKQMANVEAIYANKLAHINLDFDKDLPYNFMVNDGSIDVNECGTRTRAAMLITKAYANSGCEVDAYIIRATAYTPLGMGLVAHFTKEGLKEVFFLKYDPNSSEEMFIDKKKKVVGVYRTYKRVDGETVLDQERIVNPKEIYTANEQHSMDYNIERFERKSRLHIKGNERAKVDQRHELFMDMCRRYSGKSPAA